MSDSEKIVNFPDPGTIDAEAALWVIRLDDGKMSAESYAEFQAWQRQSPAHREALSRLTALWSDFDILQDPASPFRGNAGQDAKPSSVRAISWRGIGSIAAGIVVMLGGVFWYSQSHSPASKPVDALASMVRQHHETAVGAQETVSLPDGSKVLLNTDTSLDVVFSAGRRDVHLRRGEACFVVVHDVKRPFTVVADKRLIRDVGTAFDVRLMDHGVEVAVAKGSVELAHASGGASEKRLGVFDAGYSVTFDERIERSEQISQEDMSRKLSWRDGALDYNGEPLSKVLADFSRYTGIDFELRDESLKGFPVGGHFEISKLDKVFLALTNFGLRAQWLDAKHVVLYSAKDTAPKTDAPAPQRQ
jgi:transmembrane sensor